MSRSGTHAARIALASAVLLSMLAATGAGAARHTRVSAGDRAATRELLSAELAYYNALVAAAPASRAAVEQLAGTLAADCPGVMTGAPHFGLETFLQTPENKTVTARQEGELSREYRQWFALEEELLLAVGQAAGGPARAAAAEYSHAVSGLRWSDPTVTTIEHETAAELEFELRTPAPTVCADMRSWVASSYKTLTPASKTIERESDEVLGAVTNLSLGQLAPLLGDPLRRYEGPSELALDRRVQKLKRTEMTTANTDALRTQLERTLGLQGQLESELLEHPRKGSVEIAHQHTLSGRAFKIWLEPPQSGASPLSSACKLPVAVEEEEPLLPGEGHLPLSSQTCLAVHHRKAPRVQCNPQGLLVIEVQTPPRARRASLMLSNGRRVSSRVALVPARLGGPAGLYFQVVRGPSPVPVSLTELDARGRVLRIVKLPPTERCRKRSLLPTHVHVRALARGTLPGGTGYAIVGERSTFLGETRTVLRAQITQESLLGFALGLGSGGILERALQPQRHHKPMAFALLHRSGCRPTEFTILYGVLRKPSDRVLVRIAGKLHPLHRTRIPAVLHLHGVLAYFALSGAPEAVIVRTRSGKTVSSDDLLQEAHALRETCEGEAEG